MNKIRMVLHEGIRQRLIGKTGVRNTAGLVILKNGIACMLLCLLLSGCAVLTDSQVKNINAFAACAKGYSAFPSTVVKPYAELHR